MSRSLLVNIHLYTAALFAPVLLMMACSGGLYLLGIKGSVDQTTIDVSAGTTLNLDSSTLEQDIAHLLASAGESDQFEYIKRRGANVITRPTSREYYQITQTDTELRVVRNSPDLQAGLIELHKGHGPRAFKTFQKFMALGLLLILLSGVYLGLSSPRLRMPTFLTSAVGLVLFLLLGFIV